MPTSCSAYGCRNHSQKQSCQEAGISFHLFPHSNSMLMNKWLVSIRRKNFRPSANTKICSAHFEESCFRYQNFTNARFLKKDAIPTKFCFTPVKPENKRTSFTVENVDIPSTTHKEEPCEKMSKIDRAPSVTVQTDIGFSYLIDELAHLKAENAVLKAKLKQKWNPEEMSDDEVKTFTSLDKENFFKIFKVLNLEKDLDKSPNCKLNPLMQFFVFMKRLRTGVSLDHLAYLFEVSAPTISRTINYVASILYAKMKSNLIWPDREQVDECMPLVFKKKYPRCRIIIDCTEFPIQQSISHSKNTTTAKALIGIAPSGGITFISELFYGSVSDKEYITRSGLLKLLEKGDVILADKEFLVQEELNEIGCKLAQPLFLTDKIQFTVEEKAENKSGSHLSVHIKRPVSRIKAFKYFDRPVCYNSFHNLNELFFIAAYLTNFQNPLISIVPFKDKE